VRIGRIDGRDGPLTVRLDPDGGASALGSSSGRALIERWIAADDPAALIGERSGTPTALLAPIDDPGKVVAIGLNYVDHAAEVTMDLPAEPLVFAKFPSSIVGPGADIRWSRSVTDAVDVEAELAVIIGRPARNVSVEAALDHVFGYSCLNDVSARDLQFGDGQWVRGKSLDTFCPIGPWIVTADEIPDPQALAIRCRIGDETLQDGSTGDMIFGVAELVSRLSRAFTLEPGDVIATGTPPGIGWARDPKRLLRDGETVAVEIEGIGVLENRTVVDA
jgi:2-keto-4-pentenoate hydratase/2-oxohepta-3-ene-1,7-dioic acid hydratase in catechol pathway